MVRKVKRGITESDSKIVDNSVHSISFLRSVNSSNNSSYKILVSFILGVSLLTPVYQISGWKEHYENLRNVQSPWPVHD